MGANIALTFAARYPTAVASLIIVGCGSGTVNHDAFVAESERLARVFEARGPAVAGEEIAHRPGRRVYADKDPRGYGEFVARLREHSAHGAAAAIRWILVPRKTITEMEPAGPDQSTSVRITRNAPPSIRSKEARPCTVAGGSPGSAISIVHAPTNTSRSAICPRVMEPSS